MARLAFVKIYLACYMESPSFVKIYLACNHLYEVNRKTQSTQLYQN